MGQVELSFVITNKKPARANRSGAVAGRVLCQLRPLTANSGPSVRAMGMSASNAKRKSGYGIAWTAIDPLLSVSTHPVNDRYST